LISERVSGVLRDLTARSVQLLCRKIPRRVAGCIPLAAHDFQTLVASTEEARAEANGRGFGILKRRVGIALYEKFGFEVEGTHRRLAFRDGEYVDAYSMARLKP